MAQVSLYSLIGSKVKRLYFVKLTCFVHARIGHVLHDCSRIHISSLMFLRLDNSCFDIECCRVVLLCFALLYVPVKHVIPYYEMAFN